MLFKRTMPKRALLLYGVKLIKSIKKYFTGVNFQLKHIKNTNLL